MLARSLGCGVIVLMRCGWPLRPSRSVPEKLSDLKLGRQYEKVAGTCPWSATGTTAGHARAPVAPAASLLVSTARSSCGGGVPRRVRTTYVGVCSSCRPNAMGAYARAQPRASSESRYSSRDASCDAWSARTPPTTAPPSRAQRRAGTERVRHLQRVPGVRRRRGARRARARVRRGRPARDHQQQREVGKITSSHLEGKFVFSVSLNSHLTCM